MTIPGYLVVAAVAYAALTTGTLMFVGRRMMGVINSKNQAESELKYVVSHLRERTGARMSAADADATEAEVGSRPCATSCGNGGSCAGNTCVRLIFPTATPCWRRWSG